MKMLSMQRRIEQYIIIYTWKILENLAPYCGIEKVKSLKKKSAY